MGRDRDYCIFDYAFRGMGCDMLQSAAEDYSGA